MGDTYNNLILLSNAQYEFPGYLHRQPKGFCQVHLANTWDSNSHFLMHLIKKRKDQSTDYACSTK